ncbi:CDP-alcohol phosphatidyltransferase family protein [Nibrella saemangeumensis]|uniref:CDP-diacylglycerol--serine O-phosphatidyltransferase n=1 Tax=Nibrella saemangeumensis TaxID=1084526 RepID=A0ABP8MZF4_9BACT
MLKHLPNAMTCANLLCGCLGIVQVFEGELTIASWLILLAAVLDFLDGFVARALRAQSPIGKELDSLADCVTFGVLPAFIMFSLLRSPDTEIMKGDTASLLPYLSFSLAVFSALRLAKFNIDTRQSDSFIGVPTPANAMVIAALPLILAYQPEYANWVLNPYVLYAYTLLMSYLLVAELPLFALKFKTFSWRKNRIKFIFLIVSALLLLILRFAAVPLIIFLYILLSVFAPKQNA